MLESDVVADLVEQLRGMRGIFGRHASSLTAYRYIIDPGNYMSFTGNRKYRPIPPIPARLGIRNSMDAVESTIFSNIFWAVIPLLKAEVSPAISC